MTKAEYQSTVYDFLKDLPEGAGVILAKVIGSKILPNEKAIVYFIEVVKGYIRDIDRSIEFSSDYKIIRKL